jgi:hypothetical protein
VQGFRRVIFSFVQIGPLAGRKRVFPSPSAPRWGLCKMAVSLPQGGALGFCRSARWAGGRAPEPTGKSVPFCLFSWGVTYAWRSK